MDEKQRAHLRKIICDNVERVRWTLEDENWKPSREYVEKLIDAYETHTAILLTNQWSDKHGPAPLRQQGTGPQAPRQGQGRGQGLCDPEALHRTARPPVPDLHESDPARRSEMQTLKFITLAEV